MKRAVLVVTSLLAALLGGCGSALDTSDLPPIDDYSAWERQLDVIGPVGGHGNSYRAIYANDIAETYTGAGLYPSGTVIVKEVRQIASGDSPGDLRYLAIMRKLDEAPPGGDLYGGWMFTRADDISADEAASARCWKTCHQAAPLDGAFLDWSSAGR